MYILSIILGVLSGICIGTGIIFVFTGLRRPGGNWQHIFFALFALGYAGAILTSVLAYKAQSLQNYLAISRWGAFFTVTTLICLGWFVSF
jgi:hypothetical protein